MTNKLLLTTALVSAAFAFSANAWAEETRQVVKPGDELSITGGKYENMETTKGKPGTVFQVSKPDKDGKRAKLTITGGTFSYNFAETDGGAIGNYGDLVIKNTVFERNAAGYKKNTITSTDNNPIGGGALSLGAQSHTHITGSTFDGNKSGKHGGAIGTRHSRDGNLEGAGLTVEDSTFKNNDAKEWGGAIANNFYHDHTGNEESVLLKGNTFTSNTAKYGGALAGLKGSATSVVGGSFVKNGFSATQTGEDLSNVTTEQGGAIITEYPNNNKEAGKLKVSGGTIFDGNRAKSGGGAIWSGGETEIYDAVFKNNKTIGTNGTAGDDMTGKHEGGGAIFVGSSSNVTIEGSTFESNSSGTAGGAIATRSNSDGKKSGLKISGSQFNGNHAEKAGGAISIGSDKEGTDEKHLVEITDTDFSGNTSALGGAIYSKGQMSITGGEFTDNESTNLGGAILNSGGNLTLTDATFDGNHSTNGGGAIYSNGANGKLTIKSGSFTNNSSEKGDGGAIHVATSSEVTIGTEDTSVLFEGNSAGEQGGAISIDAKTAKITNTTFRNNSAKNGGAMHIDGNGDKVEFAGDVVFENNTLTDGTKNDINFEKGNGTITVKDGASLSLDGGITVEDTASSGSNGPKLELEKGSTLSVNNETVIQSKVSVNGSGSSSENARLKLRLAADSDNVFDLKKNIKGFESGSISSLDVDTTNNLYNITGENGVYTATQKSASEVAANLGVKESDAGTVLGMMKIKSTNERFTKVQDKLAFIAQDDEVDSKEISRAADALGADAAPVVRTRETMLSNLIFDTANDAMDDTLTNAAVGQASGDSVFEKAKVWVKGLFNYADKDDTSKAHGFDIDTYGVAMGADKEIGDGKVGLGYAYSQSDIDGYTRDTDVDTHSVFVYGQYQPAEWYVKGVLAYSWSDYEEKKSVLGENANAKYDVDTLALQGLYGYNLHLADGYDVTPEVGLRYMSASQDAYTNGLGVRVNGRDIDVLTAVAGVKAAKTFELSNGLNIRPEVRAALTYDLTADNNDSVVTMGNTLYSVNGEKLDRFGAELGAKLATDITSNWEVSAGYEGRFRDDYSDHTGILSAKYKF